MRRGLLLVATWGIGTAAAIALALSAVQVVASKVTDHQVEPLSQSGVRQALESTPDSSAPASQDPNTTVTTVTGSSGSSGGSSGGGGRPKASGSTTTTTTTRGQAEGGSSRGRGTGTDGTTTPGGGGSSAGDTPGNASPTTTTTTAPSQACNDCRVFIASGGRVAVNCDEQGPHFMWASPANGYTVKVDKNGPPEVEVSFRSSNHRSDVQVTCTPEGQPTATIRETP